MAVCRTDLALRHQTRQPMQDQCSRQPVALVRPTVCPVEQGEQGEEELHIKREGNVIERDVEKILADADLECERGAREPVKALDPKKPSRDEIAMHELTHLPYRAWCSHCVRGKRRVADHRRVTEDRGVDEVHLDYCFLGDSHSDTNTVVVCKHAQTQAVLSTVVPSKRASHEFPA